VHDPRCLIGIVDASLPWSLAETFCPFRSGRSLDGISEAFWERDTGPGQEFPHSFSIQAFYLRPLESADGKVGLKGNRCHSELFFFPSRFTHLTGHPRGPFERGARAEGPLPGCFVAQLAKRPSVPPPVPSLPPPVTPRPTSNPRVTLSSAWPSLVERIWLDGRAFVTRVIVFSAPIHGRTVPVCAARAPHLR